MIILANKVAPFNPSSDLRWYQQDVLFVTEAERTEKNKNTILRNQEEKNSASSWIVNDLLSDAAAALDEMVRPLVGDDFGGESFSQYGWNRVHLSLRLG